MGTVKTRLTMHQTGAGAMYRLERWTPSPLSKRGVWLPVGGLMSPERARPLVDKGAMVVK